MEIPKIFVISPKEMRDRGEVTEQHLRSVGLNPVMFSGLYGKNMRIMAVNRNFMPTSNPVLSPAMVSLALNHWFLWQHMVLSEIPVAIIFEDDVVLPADFKDFFQKSVADTPSDWEMIYLSIAFPERMLEGKIGAERVSDRVWRHVVARTWDGATDGLHAYMLTLEGARKATSVPFTLDEPVDRWVSFNVSPFVKTYIWYPSPIRQRSVVGEWKTTLYDEGVAK